MLDALPQREIDIRRLPEDQQRSIYEAFHLELRYNCLRKELTIRVTITADSAPAIAATVGAVKGARPDAKKPRSGAQAPDLSNKVRDVQSAPPGTRTPNPRIKSQRSSMSDGDG